MLSIRQFRRDDADEVRRLFTEGQRQISAGVERELDSYIRDSLKGDLADIWGNYVDRPGSNFWVLKSGGQLVGIAGLQRRDSDTCELRRMAVDIGWRRRGLGRRLLETAEAFAREQGYTTICLSTITPLQPAIALYEGTGYRLKGQSRYGAVTVLHYSKNLLSDPNHPESVQS